MDNPIDIDAMDIIDWLCHEMMLLERRDRARRDMASVLQHGDDGGGSGTRADS